MYQDSYQFQTRFSVFPPVIKNLLIINGLVFLAQMTPFLQDWLMQWSALWPVGAPGTIDTPNGPARVPGFYPWQVITYAFMHGGLSHLFFNMFALWMFGINIEYTMGSQRFTTYYFVSVIGAAFVQLTVAWLSGAVYPTIGASGGVMGILLAFGMLFPNQRIYLLFPPIPLKAKYLVIGYAVIDLWAGVSGTQQGVANFAHLGGMAFGLLLILYWRGKLPIRPDRTMPF